MTNEHLVPVVIVDLVEKVFKPSTHVNEKINYETRLIAIRDYCQNAINRFEKKK